MEPYSQYDLDMGNVGIPAEVTPVRCEHGVNTWSGHECGLCEDSSWEESEIIS